MVEAAIDQLRHATRAAGVGRGDPMMPLLESLAQIIRFFGKRTADSDRTGTEASLRIVQALTLAKSTADAERRVFEASLATAQARTISDISSAIARSAEAALTRRVRVFDRNTTLIAVAVLFSMTGVCLTGGYWWGSSNALAGIHETEAGLRAAFANGPVNAKAWADLLEWNPIRESVERCNKPGFFSTEGGRKVCSISLWIEPPKPTTSR